MIEVNVWELKRGDKFRVSGCDDIFVFDHMDGMYCFATNSAGEPFNWSGPVERVQ